tara:strand:- start:4590 stop:5123 length:534 start_codon:yes stop_codon:yes gene_type:complete
MNNLSINKNGKRHFEIGNKTWQILRFMVVIWVGFSLLNFLIPVTAAFSQKTDIVLTGYISNAEPIKIHQNSVEIDGTRFDLITDDQIAINNTIDLTVHDGQKLSLIRNYDFVVFPLIYNPETKIWDETFVNGDLKQTYREDSPKSGQILYLPSALLGGTLFAVGFGLMNHKSREDEE